MDRIVRGEPVRVHRLDEGVRGVTPSVTRQRAANMAMSRFARPPGNLYARWRAARPWDRFCAMWRNIGAAEVEYQAARATEWWAAFLKVWRDIGKDVARDKMAAALLVAHDAWLDEHDPRRRVPMVEAGTSKWARVLAASGVPNAKQTSGLLLYDKLEFDWMIELRRASR